VTSTAIGALALPIFMPDLEGGFFWPASLDRAIRRRKDVALESLVP
jgi:hypothetical protein